MSKSTAIRVRMDLAKPADLSDLQSVANATKAVEALKDAATELGFVLTADVTAKVGSFAFDGEDEPEIKAEPETADDGEA